MLKDIDLHTMWHNAGLRFVVYSSPTGAAEHRIAINQYHMGIQVRVCQLVCARVFCKHACQLTPTNAHSHEGRPYGWLRRVRLAPAAQVVQEEGEAAGAAADLI
jgi:hypothetical protein